jgi:hypothetical protein
MTVLIIGSGEAARSSAQALPGDSDFMHQCPTLEAGLTLLSIEPAQYSAVFVEQADSCRTSISQRISDTGTPAAIIFIDSQDSIEASPGNSRKTSVSPPMCSIERTEAGAYRLHCAMSQAHQQPSANPGLREALEEYPPVFAYTAPCRRRG